MSYTKLIADSNMAFAGNQFELALDYAEKAIKAEPKQTEGYYCAGKACMSLNKSDDAVSYFKKAVEISPNGNGFFLLGYAQAGADKLTDALKSLTRAIENNCDTSLKGQVYKIMSMINTETQDFKNALLNLEQAEEQIGIDYELLQQKAACYAGLRDYKNAVYTLNQMKLLKPNQYLAYGLAFHIFMETRIYDEALEELDRAEKYAELNMSYYRDRISYILLHDADKDNEETSKVKWNEALKMIDVTLHDGKPDTEDVFELYLRAANIYISLDNADMALHCLDASLNPVSSFNNNFSVLPVFPSENTDSDIDYNEFLEEEQDMLMQERWEDGEFEELEETINEALTDIDSDDPDEISEIVHEYLSPTDKITGISSQSEKYTLSRDFKPDTLQSDMQTSLYLTVYEMQNDYENMLAMARMLQSSENTGSQYAGIYYELKYGKYTNVANWQKKYQERINFWTRRMLENPTDFMSGSYRVRSYLDLGDFKSAEELCSCLPNDVQPPLLEEIRRLKAKGGVDSEYQNK